MRTSFSWTYENEEGEEIEVQIPARWEICDVCHGEGKHSLDIGMITADEWNQEWSYEEREDYMSGRYDRQCECCCGSGKVKVADLDSMDPELRKRYEEWEREEAEYEAICRAERRMGC